MILCNMHKYKCANTSKPAQEKEGCAKCPVIVRMVTVHFIYLSLEHWTCYWPHILQHTFASRKWNPNDSGSHFDSNIIIVVLSLFLKYHHQIERRRSAKNWSMNLY